MLGIISGNNGYISDVPANYNNINIHASSGGLAVENLNSFPSAGTLYLAGGMIGHQNQSFSDGVHSFKLKHDERFMVTSPPYFPLTNGLEIVSWFK